MSDNCTTHNLLAQSRRHTNICVPVNLAFVFVGTHQVREILDIMELDRRGSRPAIDKPITRDVTRLLAGDTHGIDYRKKKELGMGDRREAPKGGENTRASRYKENAKPDATASRHTIHAPVGSRKISKHALRNSHQRASPLRTNCLYYSTLRTAAGGGYRLEMHFRLYKHKPFVPVLPCP